MKNSMPYLIIGVLALLSCRSISNIQNSAYIGMPISEFKTLAGKWANIEAMESGYTVYRVLQYDKNAVPNRPGWDITKYYYFDSTGKLIKVDQGEFKQERYQLEIINK